MAKKEDVLRGMPFPEYCAALFREVPYDYNDDLIMKALAKYSKKKNIVISTTPSSNKKGFFWRLLAEEENG